MGIPIIVGILGIFIGREWQKHDWKRTEDKNTITKIINLLPSTGSIYYIWQEDFGNAFAVDSLKDLFKVCDNISNPELIFMNRDLEKIRKALFNSVKIFTTDLGQMSRPSGGSDIRFNRIYTPEEPDDEGWEIYEKNRQYFNDLSHEICSQYDDLIRLGKSI